ncbi:2a02d9c9-a056-4a2b-bc14-f83e51db672b [Sclerotinia trifoliorum]|uniref:2a02d9c9-a056-4a2b-bc14-f83e51db672b n=1 Tax=Sclerotinia trifoliorum TaxID=28548 RepID=A0A8H2W3D6_9HELO|nr:2a02d9c9-a056-4a2b-bc14-f83e51db672b [Sclerotinia trifoliorum]
MGTPFGAKSDSMHPRERAAATIRETSHFHPLHREEIGRGMNSFESWHPYIAKHLEKRKADEDASKKTCEDLLKIERMKLEKKEEAVGEEAAREEAAKMEGDMTARTIEFTIQKRKEDV